MHVAELTGLWRRSLLAWPDGTSDTTTQVHWLQGLRMYADLRQPAAKPDLSHARGLEDLSVADCAWLATQKGFAGHLDFDGRHFEWTRRIDFQPPSPVADAGSLEWQAEILVERGRDSDYVEHWQRAAAAAEPCGAVFLHEVGTQTKALLLRVGAAFMFARDRRVPLPAGRTLSDLVAAAPAGLARSLVDCEISFGQVVREGFRIIESTLPYRVGRVLGQRVRHDTVTTADAVGNAADAGSNATTREWQIIDREGDADAL